MRAIALIALLLAACGVEPTQQPQPDAGSEQEQGCCQMLVDTYGWDAATDCCTCFGIDDCPELTEKICLAYCEAPSDGGSL